MKLVLEKCLEREKKDVVILCNNLYEVYLVKEALAKLVGKKSVVPYIPYLKKVFPNLKYKKSVLNKIKTGCVLISDYRSYRGCEASHSIVITDLNKSVGANIMVEMMTRTMAYLDIIVLPKIEDSSNINPVALALAKWNKRGWVEHITVEINKETGQDEDNNEITFNLNRSTYEKSIKSSEEMARSRDDFEQANAVDDYR